MTLRGVLRTIAAAERRAQREAEQRTRAAERRRRFDAKTNDLEKAALEVEANELRIQHLTTLHREAGEAIDWIHIVNLAPPETPVRSDEAEQAAQRDLLTFRPTFMQRLFQTADAIRRSKEDAVLTARQEDDRVYSEATLRYQVALNVWTERHDLALSILNGDLSTFRDVCDMLEPLSALSDDVESTSIDFFNAGTANVTIVIKGSEAIPDVTKTLTRNGRLNLKPVPPPLFHRWYKDYACGCALRSGRELFACLPLERVVVNVKAPLPDAPRAVSDRQTVLSAVLTRQASDSVQFDQVSPAEAMRHFFCRMGFSPTEGVTEIEEIQAPQA